MKRFPFAVVALLSVSLLGGGCQVTPRLVNAPVTPSSNKLAVTPMGVLDLENGQADITRGDTTAHAQDGVELLPGDTITVTSGTAALTYPDAGVSYLPMDTVVTVLPDGQGQGSVFTQIELAAGSIWTHFERALGTDERFSVNGNGVVATVRGTAFAMELLDGQANVMVADHQVDVSVLEARKDAKLASKVLHLQSGQSMRVGASDMKKLDATKMKQLVHALTTDQKERKEFKTMAAPVPTKLMKLRAKNKMQGTPVIPTRFLDRIDPTTMELLMGTTTTAPSPTFAAPTRTIMPTEIAPTRTP